MITVFHKKVLVYWVLIIISISMSVIGGCQIEPRNSGIIGTVVIGPIHPVEKIGEINQEPYPDAVIVVKSKKGSREIKRAGVDKNGAFRINLPADEYILEPLNTNGRTLPFAKPIEIKVLPDQFTYVTVVFDSGIR
jgi:hypothetical protein